MNIRHRALIDTAQFVMTHIRTAEKKRDRKSAGFLRNPRVFLMSRMRLCSVIGDFVYIFLETLGRLPTYRILHMDTGVRVLYADHANGVVRSAIDRVFAPDHPRRSYTITTDVPPRTALLKVCLRNAGMVATVNRTLPARTTSEYFARMNLVTAVLMAIVIIQRNSPVAAMVSLTSDRKRLGIAVAAAYMSVPLGGFFLDRYTITRKIPFPVHTLFVWSRRHARAYGSFVGRTVIMPSPLQAIRLPGSGTCRAGILLNARCDLNMVRQFVNYLLNDHGIQSVLIRPHPGFTGDEMNVIDNAEVTNWRRPLSRFLSDIDIAFAPNSNVVIDALIHGVPTAYVSGWDPFPYDQHGYVRDGIVLPWSEDHSYPDVVHAFYTGEAFRLSWASVGYQSDPKPERDALRELVGGQS